MTSARRLRALFRTGAYAAALGAVAILGTGCTPSADEPPVAASPSPSARKVLVLPPDLGGRPMMIVPDNSGWGKDLHAALARAFPGADATAGETYKSTDGKEVILAGVVAMHVEDRQAALVTALESLRPVSGWRNPGLTVGRVEKVAAVGPDADIECGPADGGGADFPVCAWATDDIIGVVVFSYQKPGPRIESEFHQIRAALEASVV